MDFIDFSVSCQLLVNFSKSILENSDTLVFDKETSPDFYTEDSKLFINLGLSQGWVIVDVANNSAHHVPDVGDKLTDDNLCNNYLAQVLFMDLSYSLEIIFEELGLTEDGDFDERPKNSLPL